MGTFPSVFVDILLLEFHLTIHHEIMTWPPPSLMSRCKARRATRFQIQTRNGKTSQSWQKTIFWEQKWFDFCCPVRFDIVFFIYVLFSTSTPIHRNYQYIPVNCCVDILFVKHLFLSKRNWKEVRLWRWLDFCRFIVSVLMLWQQFGENKCVQRQFKWGVKQGSGSTAPSKPLETISLLHRCCWPGKKQNFKVWRIAGRHVWIYLRTSFEAGKVQNMTTWWLFLLSQTSTISWCKKREARVDAGGTNIQKSSFR